MRYSKKIDRFLFLEEELPLETVILLIGGMALAITGGLLFPISAGRLPYYENGLFGLFLIIFALQTITLGKTPFGEMRRSKSLLFFGVAIAAIGIITCFIPGLFEPLPRILLFACFGLGGGLQLLRACLDKTRMRTWMQYGGIFRHLLFACWGVYGLSVLAGFRCQHPSRRRSWSCSVLRPSALAAYCGWFIAPIPRRNPPWATGSSFPSTTPCCC